LLRKAGRIGIYAGWGVTTAKANAEVQQLAELLQAPVVHSSNGRGAISDRHPLALPGTAGRALFPHCDVILVIGSRMMDSGGKTTFSNFGNAKMIFVNTEDSEFSAPRNPEVAILADAKLAIQALLDELGDMPARPSREAETAKLREWTEVQFAEVQPQWGIIQALRRATPEDGITIGEMTQVSYVSRMAYPVYAPRTHLTPGYQGTLGFGYCTALGAAAANPGKAVVSINGDGGFLFGANEMASAKQHNLPVVAVVFNDKAYGNVKRLQQMQFGRNYGVDLVNPDFVKFAEAFGIQAECVEIGGLEGALRSAIASKAPALIEVPVGEMPNPSHLNSESAPRKTPAPPNPLVSS
jgi:acetolactate synthase-1/2/3 large subunit